jgi:hypothetical protein
VNVKEIVFFQLRKLLIKSIRVCKVKLVVIKVVIEVNQIKFQQLFKAIFQPLFILKELFSIRLLCFRLLLLGILCRVNRLHFDAFMDVLNIVPENDSVLTFVCSHYLKPLVKSLLLS